MPPREDITFACQECGKVITFPIDRRGAVETCPYCFNYVDVPHKTAAVLDQGVGWVERSPTDAVNFVFALFTPFRINVPRRWLFRAPM
jgi:hypothetical protein